MLPRGPTGKTLAPADDAGRPPGPPLHVAAARLAVIDPHRAKAELWHFFCAHYWGFEVVAREQTGIDGISAVARHQPDLVLAALTPPDLGLVDFVRQLRAAAPGAKLVLLVAACHDYQLHLLGSVEFHGLLFEAEEGLAAIGQAIERVRQGIRVISPRLQQRQAALRAAPTSFTKLLTEREEEVLICVGHAMTDEEIGRHLHLSAGTVLSHRQKIMRKLGIHRTPKLIRYCTEKGFNSVPPPSRSDTARPARS